MGGATSVYEHEVMIQAPRKPREEIPEPEKSEVHISRYEIQIPSGVPPHGYFQAICGGKIVKVQAPENCKPGQIVHIDLEDATTDHHHDETATQLFTKYDYDRSHSISIGELQQILKEEFHLPPQSDELLQELRMSGVNYDHALTFDEFQHWVRNVKTRLKISELRHQRQTLLGRPPAPSTTPYPVMPKLDEHEDEDTVEETPSNATDSPNVDSAAANEGEAAEGDSALPPSDNSETKTDAEKASQQTTEAAIAATKQAVELQRQVNEQQQYLAKLLEEHKKLKEQCAQDTQQIANELEQIKKEREVIENQRKQLSEESSEFQSLLIHEQRNKDKQRLFELQQESNHKLIEQMKADYCDLIAVAEADEEEKKARQRDKIQAKISKKKSEDQSH